MPLIDLHCHTTASDGIFAPGDLVAHARERGVEVIAVTDHDSVAGVSEALEAGTRHGVRVIPGVELSTRRDGRSIHLLGYFVDHMCDGFVIALEEMRAGRVGRARAMVDRLRELGFDIDFSEVVAQAGDSGVIARPHIARVLVERGHIPSVRDAFSADLIGDSGRAYVPREEIRTDRAIALVRDAGGVAVVAHPGVSHHDGVEQPIPDDVLAELVEAGVSGLEVDHPDHGPLVKERLRAIARKLRLAITGGSDWHGLPEHTLGGWTTAPEELARLESIATAGG